MADWDDLIERLVRARPALTRDQRVKLALLLAEPEQVPAPPPPPRKSELVLTMEEAARELTVGRTTVYALVEAGKLRSVRIGRLRRIRYEDLQAYLDSL